MNNLEGWIGTAIGSQVSSTLLSCLPKPKWKKKDLLFARSHKNTHLHFSFISTITFLNSCFLSVPQVMMPKLEYQVLFLLSMFLLFHTLGSSSLSSQSPVSAHLCPPEQSLSLIQFKETFSIDSSAYFDYCDEGGSVTSYHKTDSWKLGTDCCSWDGVTCDGSTGQLIELDLSCSGLQGTLHSNSSLFRLSQLQKVNLAYNTFNDSPLPSMFGQLVSLTYLNLSHSEIGGKIPSEISLLSKLISLDLSSNNELRLDQHNFQRLSQNLTELGVLFLDGVDMSLVASNSLLNLSSLISLSLSDTKLRGRLQTDIFCLPSLKELRLSVNTDLRGNFPKSNWSSPLRLLDLFQTSFSGELYDSIGNLKSLKYLDVSLCNFKGSIPASLGNLEQLTHLDLSQNNFAGRIPDIFGNLTRLTTLSFENNSFSNQLPSSVFNLTHLSYIVFSHNQLVGPLPYRIAGLSNLIVLYLDYNFLNGRIPSWLFTLPSLEVFVISWNNLSCPFPPDASNLSELTLIDLSYNSLSGRIPHFLFRLPFLQQLYLNNNNLTGPIPASLSELVNLTELNLSVNNLSGTILANLLSMLINLVFLDLSHNPQLSLVTGNNANTSLSTLQWFVVSHCNITEFPSFLRTVQSLEVLDLSNNRIHGQISISNGEMGGWQSLTYLDISHNFITGLEQHPWKSIQTLILSSNLLQGPFQVPPPSTSIFLVSNNQLTGEIPSSICNLSSLQILDLSNNSISGKVPKCLGKFSNSLSVLDLRMNNFRGSIPGAFLEGNSIRTLGFSDNKFEGPLSRSLVNCSKLEVLDLGYNKINDTFPHWLGTLQELQVLALRSNSFHGPIGHPTTRLPFPKLRILDLSKNEFNGALPTQYFENLEALMNEEEDEVKQKYMGDEYYQDSVIVTVKGMEIEYVRILTIFTAIDLSNNQFQGQLPEVLGNLASLHVLNFSHNNLTGHIPSSVAKLAALESLDLSSNNLDGEIPRQLIGLTFLEVLNLSYNQLVGSIPQANQFGTFQNDSYIGNLGLCGFPLSQKCYNAETPKLLPPAVQEEDESASGFFDWKIIMMGYGCGLVFGLSSGYIIFSIGKPLWFVRTVERGQNKIMGRLKQRRRRRRN